ncbi:GNAT family N-acetyltransferase [Roseisolibacter agri]|uniref:N-acetyltransferase n=1 Tax=Roseisolibacter agri TaxID=2014610 RepID=A0AA37V5W9_9BACT|nr:GNAT family N-acetyltransferase [Roseisolibacter agri]GLC24641.1 N-acetyltransferase [Roseisolibacter agri]
MIEIRANDSAFTADAFLALVQRVWPRDYDTAAVAAALTRTMNIGAWDGDRLVGAVRVLSDGYLFACVSEILVEPTYQGQGLGRRLMDAALAQAPRGKLFLGAQPQAVGFFERLGYARGPVGFVAARLDAHGAPERAS